MKAIPRVLVVEDEDNIAAALEFLITREGFGHDRVAIGAEALPRIAATPPRPSPPRYHVARGVGR